jgi:Protein of unknown function (DUF3562)
MRSALENQDDKALNQRAIEELAREVDQPVADVMTVYEDEFARLKSDAKITDYLVLFARRRTRETLLNVNGLRQGPRRRTGNSGLHHMAHEKQLVS